MCKYPIVKRAVSKATALLVAAFGAVALVLAAVGLYGVMSAPVREQTREIGVRVALGATTVNIRDSVLRPALVIAGGGSAVGLAGAVATTRFAPRSPLQREPNRPRDARRCLCVAVDCCGAGRVSAGTSRDAH